jgi:hypothetical protein
MDKETLEALEGSISKWEKIVAGTGEDQGRDNCSLCSKFYDLEGPEDLSGNKQEMCYGCPVSIASGIEGCVGTPYSIYSRAQWGIDHKDGSYEENSLIKFAAAQRELDFLMSLRPDSVVEPAQFITSYEDW